jgi:glycosyltransferase involved in cell wall biosynthesis
MKIIGITRIRNEAKIIKATLDHVSKLVDEIYVYDDCSEDSTVEICKAHHAVKGVIKGKTWASTPGGRRNAEGQLRQAVYDLAVKNGADWVYYFDADEYIEFEGIDWTADSYYFRLFDFYITEEDKAAHYLEREWMGPEYRDIPMLFKVNPNIKFTSRIPKGRGFSQFGGYVKHYGKAISVEEWDLTCHYYINHRWKDTNPILLQRWKDRVGKAVHVESDFCNPLVKWSERKTNKVFKLVENKKK